MKITGVLQPSKQGYNRSNGTSLSKIKNPTMSEMSKDQLEGSKTSRSNLKYSKRIFLYVKLKHIDNLPNEKNKMEIELTHAKNTITKLQDHYTTNTTINVADEEQPTLSLTVEQDSIDDLNLFSDNPLLLTLYEYLPRDRRAVGEIGEDSSDINDYLYEMEEDEQKYPRPIAQGYIDLLQFFSSKRAMNNINTYLYPLFDSNAYSMLLTSKTTWEVYTLLPPLRDLTFCNVVFITFESIYNAEEEVMNQADDLIASLSIRSTYLNDLDEYNQTLLCTYSMFSKEIIAEQNCNHKWETLKDLKLHNVHSLCVQSGMKVDIYKLFQGLLREEGVNFDFDAIKPEEEEALICNSLHRFILTEKLSRKLEHMLACREQNIFIQVYNKNEPTVILLQGTLDPAIFLYPDMSTVRCAVKLSPPKVAVDSLMNLSSRTSKAKKSRISTAKSVSYKDNQKTTALPQPKQKIVFAIINVCFFTPLTNYPTSMVEFNEDKLKRNRLRRCLPEPEPVDHKHVLLDDAYRDFDNMVVELMAFIHQNDIKSRMDKKAFFCSQMANAIDILTRLVAYDFNLRFPTTTNIEFSRLLTTVYQELEIRSINIIENSSDVGLDVCSTGPDGMSEMITMINTLKCMEAVGDTMLETLILGQVTEKYSTDHAFQFYMYLYNIERQKFDEVRKAHLNPFILFKCSLTEIVEIYIKYMEILQDKSATTSATELVLIELTEYVEKCPNDLDAWILFYSIYKSCDYAPGIAYTRWKFEEILHVPHHTMPVIPKTRWSVYLDLPLKPFRSDRSNHFLTTMQLFLDVGLYNFASFVFEEIAIECNEHQRYFMTVTFKIFMNSVDNLNLKTLSKLKGPDGALYAAVQSHVNGNVEFCRNQKSAANKNYVRLLNTDGLPEVETFHMSILRYGYYFLETGDYHRAKDIFMKCCTFGPNALAAKVAIGKIMYKLGDLTTAEFYLDESTEYKIHIPDVWGYLAAINMRQGRNFRALECWKYAHLDDAYTVPEEITTDLAKILYEDVVLHVDYDLLPNEMEKNEI